MKIALLGATGFVGRAAASALAGRPGVEELVLVDYDIRAAKRMAKALHPSCRWAMADVGRAPDLERLLGSVDAVASAVGPCAEYERPVLLTCAAMGAPAASVGDGTLPPEERREIHDAFRRAGAPAVSGCGLMPGFTELLAAHFLRNAEGGGQPSEAARERQGTADASVAGQGATAGTGSGAKERRRPDPTRFLFFSPALFGGYAFFRRVSAAPLRPAAPVAGLPEGAWFDAGGDVLVGLPEGRPAALFARVGAALAPLGGVGRELSSAFRLWLRGWMDARPGTAAAAAGIAAGGRALRVEDPEGRLAGRLLGETALALARTRGRAKGLLAIDEVIGREEAERIAKEAGARIVAE